MAEETAIEPVIARRSSERTRETEAFDEAAYRQRNRIERSVGWLKECRRFATRYDKLAVRFLAMIKLTFIRRYLRPGFSNRA